MHVNLTNLAATRSVGALREYSIADLLRLEWLAAAAIALRVGRTVRAWRERATTRHALARMGSREWGDIGLSRGDVQMEVRKPFWQA